MGTINCLFLDIGGVLLSNGWGHEFRHRAADHFHLEFSEFEARHELYFTLFEEGRITLDKYLDRVVFYRERDFTKREFTEFMFALSTPHTKTIEFLTALKHRYGLRVIAVSNESRELNAHRIYTFELTKLIDFFVSSCYVHLRKPDEAIFRLALDGARVPAGEIVFIDDVELFVEAARGIGLLGIHHTDLRSTSAALAALGLSLDKNAPYA